MMGYYNQHYTRNSKTTMSIRRWNLPVVLLLVLLVIVFTTTKGKITTIAWTTTTTTVLSNTKKTVLSRRTNNNVVIPFPFYMSDQPSDTTGDDIDYPGYGISSSTSSTATTTTQSTETSPSPNKSKSSSSDLLVSNLFELLPTASILTGSSVSNEVRAAINELLYKLEGTTSGDAGADGYANSPLLNGVWELKYYGGYTNEYTLPSPTRQLALFLYSGGYSPAMFAYQTALQLLGSSSSNPLVSIGEVEVTISRVQPRIEAKVPVQLLGSSSNTESSIVVTSKLDVKSNIRIRETYESINVLGTTNIELPGIFQYGRDLYITYVDNDLLIVRDGTGIPEVLVRKSKQFVVSSWGTDPTDIDDTIPPGIEPPSDVETNDIDDSDSEPSY